MNDNLITRSIEAKELKLDFIEKFNHYALAAILISIPISVCFIFIKANIEGSPKTISLPSTPLLIIPFVIGILTYKWQRYKLRLKTTANHLDYNALHVTIKNFTIKHNWILKQTGRRYFILKTDPSILTGSWGEQITILIDNENVLVNSICDPDKPASVSSFGRNKKNEAMILEEIQKSNHQKITYNHEH